MSDFNVINHEFNIMLNILKEGIQDIDKTIGIIYEFYLKNKRHRYSYISKYINDTSQYDVQTVDYILMNIDYIIDTVNNNPKKVDKIIKEVSFKFNGDKELSKSCFIEKIEKLYDHIALEGERIRYSKTNENNTTNYIVDRMNMTIESSMMELNQKSEQIQNNLNTNVISIVGIFSAIIFVFFGGLNNLSNAFAELKSGVDIENIAIISIIIGMVMFNIIFLLLYCISKMTNSNIGRLISRRFYEYERLFYYWEEGRKKVKNGQAYFINNNEYMDIETNKTIKLSEEKKEIIKGAKFNKRLASLIIHLYNYGLRIFLWIYNSIIGTSIRRFPYIFMINIIMVIIIIVLIRS